MSSRGVEDRGVVQGASTCDQGRRDLKFLLVGLLALHPHALLFEPPVVSQNLDTRETTTEHVSTDGGDVVLQRFGFTTHVTGAALACGLPCAAKHDPARGSDAPRWSSPTPGNLQPPELSPIRHGVDLRARRGVGRGVGRPTSWNSLVSRRSAGGARTSQVAELWCVPAWIEAANVDHATRDRQSVARAPIPTPTEPLRGLSQGMGRSRSGSAGRREQVLVLCFAGSSQTPRRANPKLDSAEQLNAPYGIDNPRVAARPRTPLRLPRIRAPSPNTKAPLTLGPVPTHSEAHRPRLHHRFLVASSPTSPTPWPAPLPPPIRPAHDEVWGLRRLRQQTSSPICSTLELWPHRATTAAGPLPCTPPPPAHAPPASNR